MTYQKPELIDLSRRMENGFGGLCADGSSEADNCDNGLQAGDFCDTGGFGGVLMDNMEYANSVLTELRGLGLHLSLDDFGTGYSSLGYLQKFPIQKLKLDKSFIQQMGIDASSLEIVNAILFFYSI
ncbi:MAG: EAL domain-containing protein [Syntrophaceae bacterium]|nr:EAL domain-containing protein [Syntrophaceae bacterium]